jgi:hypothetical protein
MEILPFYPQYILSLSMYVCGEKQAFIHKELGYS